MTYDKNISNLAHEQYAKLSYDIGNPFESPQIAIKILPRKIWLF